MTAGFWDSGRAQQRMREAGLDALVLAQPETLKYSSGAFPGVATFWRRAGAAFLVVGANGVPMTAIVGDLQAREFRAQSGLADVREHRLWVETGGVRDPSGEAARELIAFEQARGREPGRPRPGTFDLRASLGLLRDVLGERGCLNGRVGLELGFVPAADFVVIREMMPGVEFVDASPLVARLRAIKHPGEIERLRRAAEFSMAGVKALLAELRPGMTSPEMTQIWRAGARQEAARRGLAPAPADWAYIAVGGDGFAPGGAAQAGDLVKIDVGCVIDGYSSDGARTAVIGPPNAAQQRVHDALLRGFELGLAMIRPGVKLAALHAAVTAAVHDAGFLSYQRGHFGHGVGASVWSEEWPFISADSDAVAEPGMTLAFETPFYVEGLGGFIIEDQLLVTDDGYECMAEAPRGLFVAKL